ncbi:hypothetical protein ACRDNQ_14630 [Palleronia sp. KMU-117]|uniref:hypothetical protein n=1 Tax=Palleronia sp. KMU-117 TaxID=3434108 RepID=UPI003D73732C
MSGRTEPELALRRIFNAAGVRPPLVLWSPADGELTEPLIRAFVRRIRAVADDLGRVRASDLRSETLGELSRWTLLLSEDGPDGPFRYRFVGENLLPYGSRGDQTGTTPEDHGGYIGAFFGALYRATAERGEWVFSEHEPPRELFVRTWQRLVVPLYDDGLTRVTGFLVMAIPENTFRAGLDLILDPVFVLDDAQVVRYCNRAARHTFAQTSGSCACGITLHGATGIALDLRMTPTEVLARGETLELVELLPKAGLIERVAITVSATQHRGHAFYVVVMRMTGR